MWEVLAVVFGLAMVLAAVAATFFPAAEPWVVVLAAFFLACVVATAAGDLREWLGRRLPPGPPDTGPGPAGPPGQ